MTESEDLLPPQLEVAITSHHLRVFGAVGALAPVTGVVLGTVDFKNEPLPLWQEKQKVHAGAQQGLGAALADSLGIPVQPDLRQEGWEVVDRGAEYLVI